MPIPYAAPSLASSASHAADGAILTVPVASAADAHVLWAPSHDASSADLPLLPVVWSHPCNAQAPALIATAGGAAAIVVEPGGHAATLLDTRSRVVRWTVAAPAHTEWSHPLVGRDGADAMVLLVGYHPKGLAVTRLNPASGAVRY